MFSEHRQHFSFLSMCSGHNSIHIFPLLFQGGKALIFHFGPLHFSLLIPESFSLSLRKYVPMDCVVMRIITNIPSYMRIHSGISNICMGGELITLFFQFWHFCCWQIFWELFLELLCLIFFLWVLTYFEHFFSFGDIILFIMMYYNDDVASPIFGWGGKKEKKTKSVMEIK